MRWEELATCVGEDTAIFFHDAGTGYQEARQFCARCPVRMACLEDALRAEHGLSKGSNMRHGMYGGATPDERAGMRWIFDIKQARSNRRSAMLGSSEKSEGRAVQPAGPHDRELQGSPR